MRRPRGVRVRATWVVLAVGVVTIVGACGGSGPRPGGEERPAAGGEPVADWNDPLVNGVEVSGTQAASTLLPFVPRLPAELGDPGRVLVTDPASADREARVFAAMYDHPSYGRFWVIERVAEMTQEELRSWAECERTTGCEGSWSLVTVGDGIEAILIEGPVATSVVWLSGQVSFDVVGPADTLTGKEAVEIADLVAIGKTAA